MALSKSLYNYSGSSLLESVIALTIISVCIYIATIVYSAVFTANTSVKYYREQNNINETFFVLQLQQDSLYADYDNAAVWDIETQKNGQLTEATVKYKDSTKALWAKKVFYLSPDE